MVQFVTDVFQAPGRDKAMGVMRGHALSVFRGYFRNDVADALFHCLRFKQSCVRQSNQCMNFSSWNEFSMVEVFSVY